MGRQRKYFYPGIPEEPGYYVYELWSGETCLYVGRVGNSGPGSMLRRLASHRAAKPWFGDVTQIVVSTFSNHEEIAAAEPQKIHELRPVHNRTYAAECKRGHPRPPEGSRSQCMECMRELQQQPEYRARVREYQQSPEYKAMQQEYRQRPEIKQRLTEAAAVYHARPEVREQRVAYWRTHNATPERKAAEREREKGRQDYYADREARPERQAYKKRWAQQRNSRPSPGQAGLF